MIKKCGINKCSDRIILGNYDRNTNQPRMKGQIKLIITSCLTIYSFFNSYFINFTIFEVLSIKHDKNMMEKKGV